MNWILAFIIVYFAISISGILILRKTANIPNKQNNHETSPEKRVSIIIPTRNEEKNIANCLDSLLQLHYSEYEIIVVDGNSDDQTQEIVKGYIEGENVKLIIEPPLPKNWVGKPWGCHVGQQAASGEILLFTDADTTHSKTSLKSTTSQLNNSKGFISLVTTQQFRSFWEHMLVIVFLIISVAVNGAKGNEKSHIANGQYMMFTRETYEILGGHKSVQNSIIEDLALGSIASEKGYPPLIVSEKDLVFARMYTSLSEIFEGFSKNLALGMNQVGFQNILNATMISLWGMFGFVALPVLINYGSGDIYVMIGYLMIIVNYIAFSIILFLLEKNLAERGTLYVLLYPLYFLIFWIITAVSLFKTNIKKEISWKNRNYSVSN